MRLFFLLLTLLHISFSQEILLLTPRKAVEIALEGNREIERIRREILSLEDIYRARKWDRFSPKIDLFREQAGEDKVCQDKRADKEGTSQGVRETGKDKGRQALYGHSSGGEAC